MMKMLSLTNSAIALAVSASCTQAAITLVNPSFYGQPNSTSQTWFDYGSTTTANAPTSTGMTAGAASYIDRTGSSDGAFLISADNPARGRIYSFSGVVNPEIDVPLPSLGAPGFSTIVLQAQVSGNPIVNSTFQATSGGKSYAATNISIATQSTTGSQGPSTEYDYTVTWTLLPATTSYALTYSPNTTSSSQSTSRVDTFLQTPEPATFSLLGLTSGGLLLRRRRSV